MGSFLHSQGYRSHLVERGVCLGIDIKRRSTTMRDRLALLIAGFQFGVMSVGIGALFGKLPMREMVFYFLMYVVVFFICLKLGFATGKTAKHTYHKKNDSNTQSGV